MDLKTLLQNWFAIYGDFSTFDFSLFTNSGIPRQNYIDFCFYTIGFTGVPETSIVPSRHFEIVCNALAGLSIESVDGITIRKCLSAVGFKHRDIGCLALDTTYTSVSAMDMQSLLLQYLLNPNNLLIAAVTSSDSKVLLTLPQYLFYSYKNKETVTVEDLLALNLITFEHVPRTRQVYLVGSTFYSSLSDADAMSILKTVYSIVCNLFNPVMLKTAPDFAFLALNECTGKQKKTAVHIHSFFLSVPESYAYPVYHTFRHRSFYSPHRHFHTPGLPSPHPSQPHASAAIPFSCRHFPHRYRYSKTETARM